jgi:hypothetical protein
MNIPESNLRNMLNSISSLNHVLNETLILYKLESSDCPDCGYDPIRNESTDPYCTTCDGKGKVSTPTAFTIPSSIETEDDFVFSYTNAGRLTSGEILATIDNKEISEVLNVDRKFSMDDYGDIKAFLDQYSYFEWKGAKYKLESFQPGYLQGRFYEISMKLSLSDSNG